MFPILIDPMRVPIMLIGNGAQVLRRLALIDETAAARVAVFAANPSAELVDAAGDRLIRRWPRKQEILPGSIVFVGDLAPEKARGWAVVTARIGAFLNVEDVTALCDFHSPAFFRRGDLVVSVSTGGKSPGLAGRLKRYLESLIGPEWAGRLDELAEARRRWRHHGVDVPTLARLTDDLIARKGWLRSASTEPTEIRKAG